MPPRFRLRFFFSCTISDTVTGAAVPRASVKAHWELSQLKLVAEQGSRFVASPFFSSLPLISVIQSAPAISFS